MTLILMVVCSLFASSSFAANLYWNATADGLVDVEYSTTLEGPFTFVARVPAQPPFFPLEPGKFGFYRLHIPDGPFSHAVQFKVDVIDDAPPTVNNLTARQIDADHIEILGQACTSLKTTGSGLKRIVECVH